MVVPSPPRPPRIETSTDRSELEAFREQALIEEARRRARRRRRGYALLLLLVLGVVAVVAVDYSGSRRGGSRPDEVSRVLFAGTAPSGGRIAISDGTGTMQIVNADGSGLQAAVRCPPVAASCQIVEPAWSPDGSQLAFLRGNRRVPLPRRTEPDSLSLYLVDAAGGPERLLAGCGSCSDRNGAHLSWSVDSTQIAFSRDSAKGNGSTIWIADTVSGEVRPLTDCPQGFCADLQPDWSPDGQQIAFRRLTDHGEYLYSVRPDGSRLTDLGTPAAADPHWSPDGRKLTFDGILGVYVSAADGSRSKLIAAGDDNGNAPGAPSWSPDGGKLAFFSTPERRTPPGDPRGFGYGTEVWTVNADGTGKTRLAHTGCCVSIWAAPVWSPDGSQIAFAANQAGGSFVVNSDGSGLHRISGADAYALAWQTTR